MLLKPVDAVGPVIVKDNVVVMVDGYDVIVTLDTCEVVTLPLIASSTISPLFVVADTFVAERAEEGWGVLVGVGVGLEVDEGVAKGVGVRVGVGEGVGLDVAVGDGDDEGVGLGWGVGVIVGVGVG
jgi:hypothetical protein